MADLAEVCFLRILSAVRASLKSLSMSKSVSKMHCCLGLSLALKKASSLNLFERSSGQIPLIDQGQKLRLILVFHDKRRNCFCTVCACLNFCKNCSYTSQFFKTSNISIISALTKEQFSLCFSSNTQIDYFPIPTTAVYQMRKFKKVSHKSLKILICPRFFSSKKKQSVQVLMQCIHVLGP